MRTTSKKPPLKSKSIADGRNSRALRDSFDGTNRSNRSNNIDGEFKSTIMQRKKLINTTNATPQQQYKTKSTGPTSPTEATIAPIYYNGNTSDSRNGRFFFS